MIPERKQLWLDALRSGEFRQGKEELRSPSDEYCCLGVACEIYRRETGRGEWVPSVGVSTNDFLVHDLGFGPEERSWSQLPRPVADWYGLESSNPIVESPPGREDRREALANLNDDGVPFEEIADLIEEHL